MSDGQMYYVNIPREILTVCLGSTTMLGMKVDFVFQLQSTGLLEPARL